MNKNCENCKNYKQNILMPCQGRCRVTRAKRNWNSKSCQFFEERDDKCCPFFEKREPEVSE